MAGSTGHPRIEKSTDHSRGRGAGGVRAGLGNFRGALYDQPLGRRGPVGHMGRDKIREGLGGARLRRLGLLLEITGSFSHMLS